MAVCKTSKRPEYRFLWVLITNFLRRIDFCWFAISNRIILYTFNDHIQFFPDIETTMSFDVVRVEGDKISQLHIAGLLECAQNEIQSVIQSVFPTEQLTNRPQVGHVEQPPRAPHFSWQQTHCQKLRNTSGIHTIDMTSRVAGRVWLAAISHTYQTIYNNYDIALRRAR